MTEVGGTSANDGTVYSLDMGSAAVVNAPLFSGKKGVNVLILGNHPDGNFRGDF